MTSDGLLASWLTWAPLERAAVRSVYFRRHSVAETARQSAVSVAEVTGALRRVYRRVADAVLDEPGRGDREIDISAPDVSRAVEELAALPIATWRWDTADEQMSWSDAMFEVYGYHPNAVAPTIGRHQAHKHRNDRLACEALIIAGATEAGPVVFPQRIYRTDGELLAAVMRVVREPGQREVLTGRVAVDVTA